MVWAIDLDDGTLIDALADNLSREKALTFAPSKASQPDWWWPPEDKTEL